MGVGGWGKGEDCRRNRSFHNKMELLFLLNWQCPCISLLHTPLCCSGMSVELITLSEPALPDFSVSLNNVIILQALFILQTLVIFDSSPFLDALKQLLNSMNSVFAV